MLIDGVQELSDGGVTTRSATVRWEDRGRPPYEAFFSVLDEDATRTSCSADAFRVPAAIVALEDGERRVAGPDLLCPVVRDGLLSAFAWLRRWNPSLPEPPQLDAPLGCAHAEPAGRRTSGLFLSGGVDSVAVLAGSLTGEPPARYRQFSVAIVIVGIQRYRWSSVTLIREQLEAARDNLQPLADVAGLHVVPVATNLRGLNASSTFWKYRYQGSVLAGVAHLFTGNLSDVSIASTWEIPHLDSWGSHPLLDPSFGSDALQIWHALSHVGRFEKTRMIANVPGLLDHLSVCNAAEAGDDNCGACEKCIRTMLALTAMNALEGTRVFPRDRLQPSDVSGIRIGDRGLEGEYLELIGPLRDANRGDLADAVDSVIRRNRLRRSVPVAFAASLLRDFVTPLRQARPTSASRDRQLADGP